MQMRDALTIIYPLYEENERELDSCWNCRFNESEFTQRLHQVIALKIDSTPTG